MSRIFLASALAFALPSAALAGELSYSYFEAGFLRALPDEGGDASGFGLHGSGTFNEHLHILASYERLDEDGANADGWRVGIGYNAPLNDGIDFIGRVVYDSFSADRLSIGGPASLQVSAVELEGHSLSAELGVRAALGPRFEAGALLRHSRREFDEHEGIPGVSETDNATALVLNGQYKFNATWGINAELSWNDDGGAIFVGPRFSY